MLQTTTTCRATGAQRAGSYRRDNLSGNQHKQEASLVRSVCPRTSTTNNIDRSCGPIQPVCGPPDRRMASYLTVGASAESQCELLVPKGTPQSVQTLQDQDRSPRAPPPSFLDERASGGSLIPASKRGILVARPTPSCPLRLREDLRTNHHR